MTRFKNHVAMAALGLAMLGGTAVVPAFAFDDMHHGHAVNVDESGVAVHGYDPVAYFTVGKPTKGDAKFAVDHDGARYYFASAENMKTFQANPSAYAPQYGGFCAMGVSLERKFDGDPNVWKIVDNKLYLNKNPDVAVAWNRDVPGNIEKADDNWPEIKELSDEELQ